jgi:catechol-2,3-dioxygenase
MPADTTTPRLTLSHSTLAVRDLETMVDFYCDVLGFHVTNRGDPGDGSELAFLCQDPTQHHQIVLVGGLPTPGHEFVMVDHLAFRTGNLDDLRVIGERLADAGIEGVIPISHGNAWSLYFNDPEGNGLECFVDSPFHVAQPYAGGLDLAADDGSIEAATRDEIESLPEFQPLADWLAAFSERLDGAGE